MRSVVLLSRFPLVVSAVFFGFADAEGSSKVQTAGLCPGSGECFSAHNFPTCYDGPCCTLVCNMDPDCCLVAWDDSCVNLALAHCQPQPALRLTLEPVPGQTITGGATIVVEAFLRNDGPDVPILGYSIDLPCNLLPQLGSTGEIRAQPELECQTDADCPADSPCLPDNPTDFCRSFSVHDASAAASGSVPWAFGPSPPNETRGNGLRFGSQLACRLGSSPQAGEPPYILPGNGARRYLGTWRYQVSDCAAGSFDFAYEGREAPCHGTTVIATRDENFICIDTSFVPASLSVPVGQCCEPGGACLEDGINETCCESTNPGALWVPGGSCADPCPECVSDADCDDGQFCNGAESCNESVGDCLAGVPPVCPGSTTCIEGFCDPSSNGGSGGCTTGPRPDGTPCPDESACTVLEECFGGQCIFAPVDCPEDDEFCNGYEICDSAAGCVLVPACAQDEICDEAADTCRSAAIPTTSQWGLIVLGLALATMAKARFGLPTIAVRNNAGESRSPVGGKKTIHR